jgi:hypothetical protein
MTNAGNGDVSVVTSDDITRDVHMRTSQPLLLVSMDTLPRPPQQAGETETLLAFLDVQRAVVRWKLEDAPDDALRTLATPSGVTLIGPMRHFTDVERWFRDQWAGEEGVGFHGEEEDNEAEWRVLPGHTATVVLREYAQDALARMSWCVPPHRWTRRAVATRVVALGAGPNDRGDGPARRACRPSSRAPRRCHQIPARPPAGLITGAGYAAASATDENYDSQ